MWERVDVFSSTDEHVKKYVFTGNNAVAEAVLYKYPTYETRTVVCCSTQSGCLVGCRFCGAGNHFVRSLTAEEIISQPQRLFEDTGVNMTEVERLQIMFMSMGEPMLNKGGLREALIELHRMYPNAALLISTSAPKVDFSWLIELSKEIPAIGLQFSVHASTDEDRDRLIPYKHKMALVGIAETGLAWHQATGRPPFFNYCATEQNNSEADADRLASLFPPSVWHATVSVVCEQEEHVARANERQRELASVFSQKLLDRGYNVRVFDPAGQDDIGGGCGQLWFVQEWMRNHPDQVKPSIGAKLPKVHGNVLPRV